MQMRCVSTGDSDAFGRALPRHGAGTHLVSVQQYTRGCISSCECSVVAGLLGLNDRALGTLAEKRVGPGSSSVRNTRASPLRRSRPKRRRVVWGRMVVWSTNVC